MFFDHNATTWYPPSSLPMTVNDASTKPTYSSRIFAQTSGGGDGIGVLFPKSIWSTPPPTTITGEAAAPAITEGYLHELLAEKRHLDELLVISVPPPMTHTLRMLNEEIRRVQAKLATTKDGGGSLSLPPPVGPIITVVETLAIPVDRYPGYNFVGRILGPRGMTVKQLEQDTGCSIAVKGRGTSTKKSMGESSSESDDADLCVVISAEDTENRACVKLQRGVEAISKLLQPKLEGDELKRKQLMELAIINGNYRPPMQNGASMRPILNRPKQRNAQAMMPLVARVGQMGVGGAGRGGEWFEKIGFDWGMISGSG